MSISIKNKYRTDYKKLYPNIEINKKLLKYMRRNDRKIQYFEYDRKVQKIEIDEKAEKITFIPALENSIERLTEAGVQIADSKDFTNNILEELEKEQLRKCIKMLTKEEQDLIYNIYYKNLTEEEYAEKSGTSQPNISQRKKYIVNKLKTMLK